MRPQFGASRAWLHQLTCQLTCQLGLVPQGRLGNLLSTFVLCTAVVVGAAGCEDQAIGRTCKTLGTGTDSQAVFNNEALECPTRLCIKPAYQPGVAQASTAPFCTAECSKNSDCDDAETRDKKNTADKRCSKGFVCAAPFETGGGPLACKKLCVCGDFYDTTKSSKIPLPTSCLAKQGT